MIEFDKSMFTIRIIGTIEIHRMGDRRKGGSGGILGSRQWDFIEVCAYASREEIEFHVCELADSGFNGSDVGFGILFDLIFEVKDIRLGDRKWVIANFCKSKEILNISAQSDFVGRTDNFEDHFLYRIFLGVANEFR